MPKHLKYPTLNEVRRLFLQNNIDIVFEDQSNPITLWGTNK